MEDKLKGKLQLLRLTLNKTKAIMEKENPEKIKRHRDILRTIVGEIEELKIEAEQAKLDGGEDIEQVGNWGKEIEERIDEADIEITNLQRYLDEAAAMKEREKKANEDILVAHQREEQLKFEKLQLEQKIAMENKSQYSSQATNKPEGKERVKLPKLVITKFDGTFEKWLPFWNKFEAEIDSIDMVAVTKFAYLKELVEPKIREAIDGLPFTTEGYERAKNILKTEYGNVSEIINAYIDNIMALPIITGTKPEKIHQFYHTLTYNVQSLESLGKLKECWGMVRSVLNKLKGIKPDLVRGQVGWQSWDFPQLIKALRTWKEIHPIEVLEEKPPPRNRSFQTRQENVQPRGCVYCDDVDHKSAKCQVVKSPADRKQKLQEKRLCFNCTGSRHRAAQCQSRTVCQHCKRKHHSSICDQEGANVAMTATHEGENVCHPVVIVDVNGLKCRALLDTGATGSYASAFLLDLLKPKPKRTIKRRIQTIMGTVTKNIEVYNLTVSNTKGDCVIPVCVTKVERGELLSLNNPNYASMMKKFAHLKGVVMEDTDTKSVLPVHMILGANEYTKIKTSGDQRTGAMGEPVAERTKFGWTIMSTGKEANMENMFLTQTMVSDYEELCRMDVLGLEDTPSGDQSIVHSEFLEQLQRSPEGWYETGLPWKGNHPPLPTNKGGSLKRLGTLVHRLKRTGMMDDYDAIIQGQLEEGIVEDAEMPATGTEFYIPHKAVVRESSQSTKLRIVYDASARSNESTPSLNDCLDVGPPLQNQLWKVLVRGRFHAVALAGDIKKAFLQVRIRAEDRDALRFHWLYGKDLQRVRTLRFTRALFGLGPSPFLLGGVIKHHLDICRADHTKDVEEIERSLYVDDLLTGGQTIQEAMEMKVAATEIFNKASFQLHKWHSNEKEVETSEIPERDGNMSYAKQQLGLQTGECGLLGLHWNKVNDTIGVTFPEEVAQPTKRGILGKVARIYDPLGLVSPITLGGKLLYREACNQKCAWDAPLSKELERKWLKWESQLPSQVDVPRSLIRIQGPVDNISLHAFGDASGKGVAASVYAVVTQSTQVYQGLVAAKARLAKQGLTIPRLELVSAHMAVNLVNNVQEALQGYLVAHVHCWLDSTVALHWIRGASGEYKEFVGNRVRKIREHQHVSWRHVPTLENPADLGSRGGPVNHNNYLWWNGPEWLQDRARWPPGIETGASVESEKEAKAIKQLFAMAIAENDELDDLLSKRPLWRTLRVCAWISRFTSNARRPEASRIKDPLTTKEIDDQKKFWIRRIQAKATEHLEEDRLRLNLQQNGDGLLECRGRIQGHYPVYLPDTSTYTEKFVQEAHEATLHGGVGLTMTKIREQHWIPRLRRLVKRIVKHCPGCKRFRATATASPPPGLLPRDRTEGTTPFEVIGVDYAGPFRYKTKRKSDKECKAYLLLYTCSLSRAVHLQLLPTLETRDFIKSLKEFIARRGRPRKIYSDNGRTFVGAAKWLHITMQDEKFNDFLARNEIIWQFNLSRAPWWGGQFERLVGLVKGALYKTIGRGFLSWDELREVLLDVEISVNNRPLSYVEEDLQMPILTPNLLLFMRSNQLPEQKTHHLDDRDLRKRAKYLQKCKQALWLRWTKEYVRGLRERHNMKNGSKSCSLAKGDVVIIRGDEKDRNHWKLGIITEMIEGLDGTVRAARLRAGKSHLERAIQHLYPLELSCDRTVETPEHDLNAEAPAFRPKRDAAVAAELRVKAIAEDEH